MKGPLETHKFWDSCTGSSLTVYGTHHVTFDQEQYGEIPILVVSVESISTPTWYKILLYNSAGNDHFEYYHLKTQTQFIVDAWIRSYDVTRVEFREAVLFDMSKLNLSRIPKSSESTNPLSPRFENITISSPRKQRVPPFLGNLFSKLSPRQCNYTDSGSDEDNSRKNSSRILTPRSTRGSPRSNTSSSRSSPMTSPISRRSSPKTTTKESNSSSSDGDDYITLKPYNTSQAVPQSDLQTVPQSDLQTVPQSDLQVIV